jgi:hypothetical protein
MRSFGVDLGDVAGSRGPGRLGEVAPVSDAVHVATALVEEPRIHHHPGLRDGASRYRWKLVADAVEREVSVSTEARRGAVVEAGVRRHFRRGAARLATNSVVRDVSRWARRREEIGLVPLFVPDAASIGLTVPEPPALHARGEVWDDDVLVGWLRTESALRTLETVLGQHRERARFLVAGGTFAEFVEGRFRPYQREHSYFTDDEDPTDELVW